MVYDWSLTFSSSAPLESVAVLWRHIHYRFIIIIIITIIAQGPNSQTILGQS